jgi:hypothetical protein
VAKEGIDETLVEEDRLVELAGTGACVGGSGLK